MRPYEICYGELPTNWTSVGRKRNGGLDTERSRLDTFVTEAEVDRRIDVRGIRVHLEVDEVLDDKVIVDRRPSDRMSESRPTDTIITDAVSEADEVIVI